MPRLITDNPTPNNEPPKSSVAFLKERTTEIQAVLAAHAPEPVCDTVRVPNEGATSKNRLDHIAEHFAGARPSGQGYAALCPCHDDSHPSLSINEGEEGRILIYCHAGCPTRDLLQIVGLTMADLMPGHPMIVKAYDYSDENGKLLFQAVRMDPKDFRQRAPDGNGGWVWKTKDVRKVLYRLPELLAADPTQTVFIVEGEKDADRLGELGLVVTTNVGGAGKWKSEYNDPLQGRPIVILRDNDEAGRKHAETVAANQQGVAASIKVLLLPDLPEKGDVSDWLDAGGTLEALLALVEETPEWNGNTVIKIISAAPSEGGNNAIKIIPPTLGEAAYLGFAGKFLNAVSAYTEATDAGVLAHLLPAVGMFIGPGPRIFAGGWQPARVNVALVGPTSCGRKGTALASVDLLMVAVDTSFWLRQRVGGLSSGEGLIVKVADIRERGEDGEEVVTPVEKRLYVIESEFSRVLANMKREGNILSHIIREAFDSGNLATLTVNPRQADGAHISIVAHITPAELSERFESIEMVNGFGNRFLWFVVKSDKIMPRTEPIPSKLLSQFAPRIRSLRALPQRSVKMNVDAGLWWEKAYLDLRDDRPGLAGAITARGSSIVLRLALIYALLEQKQDIGTEHLEAALAVWRYSEESAQMLFQSKSSDPLGDKVLRLLGNGPMTTNDFNSHLSPKQKKGIDKALELLESKNLIRKSQVKHEGPGRPATQWELV
ncbi:MAG: DUF3987 domain-containing protein [Gemmataceae bacterium]|nr:DUF3987 domain-containing protein [Gemmataceae bacterium]